LLAGSEGRRREMGRPGGLAGRRIVSAFQCASLLISLPDAAMRDGRAARGRDL
jgi:hypothetical protein